MEWIVNYLCLLLWHFFYQYALQKLSQLHISIQYWPYFIKKKKDEPVSCWCKKWIYSGWVFRKIYEFFIAWKENHWIFYNFSYRVSCREKSWSALYSLFLELRAAPSTTLNQDMPSIDPQGYTVHSDSLIYYLSSRIL